MNRKAQKESSSKSNNRKAKGKQRGTWTKARPGPGTRSRGKAAAKKKKSKTQPGYKTPGCIEDNSGNGGPEKHKCSDAAGGSGRGLDGSIVPAGIPE